MSGVHLRVDVGAERYALPVEDILEVARIGEVTPLPGAGRPFLGVHNLRGEVLPVIDLGALLDVGAASAPDQIVVAQAGGLKAGLAVDAIVGVSELPSPDTATDSPALEGAALVDDALVGVVDVAGALRRLAAQERT